MKIATAFVLAFGLLAGHYAQARQSAQGPARWVIVASIVDLTTGALVTETVLTDPGLEFDDPARCKAIVERVHPAPTGNVAAVLSCRKVSRSYRPCEKPGGVSTLSTAPVSRNVIPVEQRLGVQLLDRTSM